MECRRAGKFIGQLGTGSPIYAACSCNSPKLRDAHNSCHHPICKPRGNLWGAVRVVTLGTEGVSSATQQRPAGLQPMLSVNICEICRIIYRAVNPSWLTVSCVCCECIFMNTRAFCIGHVRQFGNSLKVWKYVLQWITYFFIDPSWRTSRRSSFHKCQWRPQFKRSIVSRFIFPAECFDSLDSMWVRVVVSVWKLKCTTWMMWNTTW